MRQPPAMAQGEGFILAGSSRPRLALLASVGLIPKAVVPHGVEENVKGGESAREATLRLAARKAEAVLRKRHGDAFVLSADTLASCGRRVFGKADSAAQARDWLRLMSGRRHRVTTAVCLASPQGRLLFRVTATVVQFRRLAQGEIEALIDGGEGRGKAGGYALQGHAAAFVKSIRGSWSGAVGLPLCETFNLLRGAGVFKGEGHSHATAPLDAPPFFS